MVLLRGQGAGVARLRTGLSEVDVTRQSGSPSSTRNVFGRHFRIELQHHLLPDDDALVHALLDISQSVDIPCTISNNVNYGLPPATPACGAGDAPPPARRHRRGSQGDPVRPGPSLECCSSAAPQGKLRVSGPKRPRKVGGSTQCQIGKLPLARRRGKVYVLMPHWGAISLATRAVHRRSSCRYL